MQKNKIKHLGQKPIEQPKQEVKPQKIENSTDKLSTLPSMTRRNFAKQPEAAENKQKEKREFKKPEKQQDKNQQTPIKRHIISQDIYQNQNRNTKKKKKEHGYNNKQEEQERISLEKTVQNKQ